MNERIEKLAEQAGKYADETQPLGSYTRNGMWLYAYNEKFAELMIVEFSDAVKQTAIRIAQTGFNDGLSTEEVNQRVNAALTVLEVVREQFGVEE